MTTDEAVALINEHFPTSESGDLNVNGSIVNIYESGHGLLRLVIQKNGHSKFEILRNAEQVKQWISANAIY